MHEVIAAHERVIADFGGLPGIRDTNVIESAIARPYCGYYRPIEKKAAALVHSLVLNHGFLDGNKRTSVFALAILLLNSGYGLKFDDNNILNAEVEEMILSVAEHRLDFDGIAAWVKARLTKI